MSLDIRRSIPGLLAIGLLVGSSEAGLTAPALAEMTVGPATIARRTPTPASYYDYVVVETEEVAPTPAPELAATPVTEAIAPTPAPELAAAPESTSPVTSEPITITATAPELALPTIPISPTPTIAATNSRTTRSTPTQPAFMEQEPPGYQAAPAASSAPTLTSQNFSPGRATQSGSSYVGIAGNIGISGNSSDLGRASFGIISKVGILRTVSVRPTVLINQAATILLPATYDFTPQDLANVGFTPAPYLGGGLAIATGSDTRVGGLLTGGLDVPLSRELTATASFNLGFLRNTDIGIYLGVGYNFRGF